jgi:hypothetical protein
VKLALHVFEPRGTPRSDRAFSKPSSTKILGEIMSGSQANAEMLEYGDS